LHDSVTRKVSPALLGKPAAVQRVKWRFVICPQPSGVNQDGDPKDLIATIQRWKMHPFESPAVHARSNEVDVGESRTKFVAVVAATLVVKLMIGVTGSFAPLILCETQDT
jgi:hypothetical protein